MLLVEAGSQWDKYPVTVTSDSGKPDLGRGVGPFSAVCFPYINLTTGSHPLRGIRLTWLLIGMFLQAYWAILCFIMMGLFNSDCKFVVKDMVKDTTGPPPCMCVLHLTQRCVWEASQRKQSAVSSCVLHIAYVHISYPWYQCAIVSFLGAKQWPESESPGTSSDLVILYLLAGRVMAGMSCNDLDHVPLGCVAKINILWLWPWP